MPARPSRVVFLNSAVQASKQTPYLRPITSARPTCPKQLNQRAANPRRPLCLLSAAPRLTLPSACGRALSLPEAESAPVTTRPHPLFVIPIASPHSANGKSLSTWEGLDNIDSRRVLSPLVFLCGILGQPHRQAIYLPQSEAPLPWLASLTRAGGIGSPCDSGFPNRQNYLAHGSESHSRRSSPGRTIVSQSFGGCLQAVDAESRPVGNPHFPFPT